MLIPVDHGGLPRSILERTPAGVFSQRVKPIEALAATIADAPFPVVAALGSLVSSQIVLLFVISPAFAIIPLRDAPVVRLVRLPIRI